MKNHLGQTKIRQGCEITTGEQAESQTTRKFPRTREWVAKFPPCRTLFGCQCCHVITRIPVHIRTHKSGQAVSIICNILMGFLKMQQALVVTLIILIGLN